jgi:hypothetical protein
MWKGLSWLTSMLQKEIQGLESRRNWTEVGVKLDCTAGLAWWPMTHSKAIWKQLLLPLFWLACVTHTSPSLKVWSIALIVATFWLAYVMTDPSSSSKDFSLILVEVSMRLRKVNPPALWLCCRWAAAMLKPTT